MVLLVRDILMALLQAPHRQGYRGDFHVENVLTILDMGKLRWVYACYGDSYCKVIMVGRNVIMDVFVGKGCMMLMQETILLTKEDIMPLLTRKFILMFLTKTVTCQVCPRDHT